ncbi:MAG: ECF transporter S component, partial [Treponema sp.]|nr:ECF transporter S component [Treponema sp.]
MAELRAAKTLPVLGKTHPAVIAVWAAVLAAAHMLPSIPMIGTGSTFSVTTALVPLAGIFFGPIPGAVCAAVGGFIGSIIAPHTAWMGLGTFIIGTTTGFTAGLISRSKWPIALAVYALGIVLWFSQEIGRSFPLLPLVYYGLGLIAVVIGGIFASRWLAGGKRGLKIPAVWLCAFGGMVGSASIGNFFSLLLYKLPKEVWATLVVVAPLERSAFSLGTVLVGVPLLIGLPKIGIFVGPDVAEE